MTPTLGYWEQAHEYAATAVGTGLTTISTSRGLAWLPTLQDNAGIDFGVTGLRSPGGSGQKSYFCIAAPRSQAKIKFLINVDTSSPTLAGEWFRFNAADADTIQAGSINFREYYGGEEYWATVTSQITGVMSCYGMSKLPGLISNVTPPTEEPKTRFFVDGRLVGATGGVVSDPNSYQLQSTAQFVIGHPGLAPGSAQAFDDPIVLVLGWTRALSDAEQFELAVNPWQVFVARKRIFYSMAAAVSTRPVVFTAV